MTQLRLTEAQQLNIRIATIQRNIKKMEMRDDERRKRQLASHQKRENARRLKLAAAELMTTEGAIDRLKKNIELWNIAEQVAAKHGVSVIGLLSPRRNIKLVRARWEAWHRAINETVISISALSKAYSKDHTTVMYGLEQFERSQNVATTVV